MQTLLETISKNFSQNMTPTKINTAHDRARRNEAAYKQDTTGGRKMKQQKEKTTNAMKRQKEKATLVITYNRVYGYEPGLYYRGKKEPLIICSYDNTETWGSEAQSKLEGILHQINGRVSPEDIKQVYLYIGKFAREGALKAAEHLSSKGNNLALVACACESEIKQQVAERIGAPIIWSECGGHYTLGEIVDGILRR